MAQNANQTPNIISFQEHDRPFHATAQNNAYRENKQTATGSWIIPATNLHAPNKNPQTGYEYPGYNNVNVIERGGKRRKHKSKKSKKIRKSKKVKKSNNTKRNH